MKKLLAMLLALLLGLTCVAASADTVYTKVTVDPEVATEALTSIGIPKAQLAMLDGIAAAVNALGVNVTTVADGAQVDLDVNGDNALSLGWTMDDAGVNVVSTLFPNYLVTLSNETITQMMEQMAQNMPGAGGEGGMDMTKTMEVFSGYYQRWFEACAAAGKPGEPVPGEYEFEGYTFDTMVPVTVDIQAIATETRALMDEILADPAAMAALQGMAQGMAQSGGAEFNPETFEADFKAGFEEWVAHFPNEAAAEYYSNSDSEAGVPFYMIGESTSDDASFSYDMLFVDEKTMDMGFIMATADTAMTAGFTMVDDVVSMNFTMNELYFGLSFASTEGWFLLEGYFMDDENPIVSVEVVTSEDGERTLPVSAEGKTTVTVEEIMANANGEAANGLFTDVQTNGLNALMEAVKQVPELGMLMGMPG